VLMFWKWDPQIGNRDPQFSAAILCSYIS
jgi:hypothetical protein